MLQAVLHRHGPPYERGAMNIYSSFLAYDPGRDVRKQKNKTFGHRRVCEDGVAQAWIGHARQHYRLHHGLDREGSSEVAGVGINHRQ